MPAPDQANFQAYDVVIVGGGPAGLSAALALGRARRRVLLCDAGEPRNAPAHAAHNVFTRDGTPPLELLQIGRAQLQPYTTVEVAAVRVESVVRHMGHFLVTRGDGQQVTARKLLLATGMRDELPPVAGLPELWGTRVAHCPYCHGWEVRDQPLAIFGNGDLSSGDGGYEFVRLLAGWSRDLILCTNGPATLNDQQRARLAAHDIPIYEAPITRLVQQDDDLVGIHFADGSHVTRHTIFMRPRQQQRSPLPAQLGCRFTVNNLIEVDAMGHTGVPGVYAAGDITQRAQSVIAAAASGTMAGSMINHELGTEEFG